MGRNEMPPVSVELVMMRWQFEAWAAVAHLPKRKQPRAFVVRMLEIARADVATTRIDPGRSASQQAQAAVARRGALTVLEAHAPGYLARLSPE